MTEYTVARSERARVARVGRGCRVHGRIAWLARFPRIPRIARVARLTRRHGRRLRLFHARRHPHHHSHRAQGQRRCKCHAGAPISFVRYYFHVTRQCICKYKPKTQSLVPDCFMSIDGPKDKSKEFHMY